MKTTTWPNKNLLITEEGRLVILTANNKNMKCSNAFTIIYQDQDLYDHIIVNLSCDLRVVVEKFQNQ
ncbi:hypothetical protein DERF_001550 [Dermatophagoides farinae]|uniref:Uncharacterized protein n=1 Tax=Dermatophagoides farinae TaxID=6954 RepID=A0A922IC22_DERFA|nr:hypothetical protein DERF_001550 [Dermatophagoides farinae]